MQPEMANAQSATRGRLTYAWNQELDRAHSFSSSILVSGIGLPSKAASFFGHQCEFGVFQALGQTSVGGYQFPILLHRRTHGGLAAPLFGGQGGKLTLPRLPPPGG